MKKTLTATAAWCCLVMALTGCGKGTDLKPDSLDAIGLMDDAPVADESIPDDQSLFDADELPGDVPVEVFVDPGQPPCIDPWEGNSWAMEADNTFIRGPYLQSVFSNSALVVWRAAQPRNDPGCVHWETGGESETSCDEPDAKGQYEVALTGLSPYTEVTYRVQVGEDETAKFTFRTAPEGNRPVRMLVAADTHRNVPVMKPIASQALQDGVDIAVLVGDLVSEPEEEQWDLYFEGFRSLMHRVMTWPVLGNHEARGQTYFDAFIVPGAAPDPPEEIYYSVRWGGVWMGMLEIIDFDIASWMGIETPEVVWLKEQLSSPEARDARWRFLFIHEPPYSVGWTPCPHYTGEAALRDVLTPIAQEYGVAVVFNGHTHGYERGKVDGVWYFVAGGAGGGLDEVCPVHDLLPDDWIAIFGEHHSLRVNAGCDLLVVEALDVDGMVFDTVEIPHVESP